MAKFTDQKRLPWNDPLAQMASAKFRRENGKYPPVTGYYVTGWQERPPGYINSNKPYRVVVLYNADLSFHKGYVCIGLKRLGTISDPAAFGPLDPQVVAEIQAEQQEEARELGLQP